MKTDRELLELAAKAAGIDMQHRVLFGGDAEPGHYDKHSQWIWWNPLTDDGDALRLAVKLGINIDMDDQSAWFRRVNFFVQEYWGGDYDPCYRRAIVRAAAAIGEQA